LQHLEVSLIDVPLFNIFSFNESEIYTHNLLKKPSSAHFTLNQGLFSIMKTWLSACKALTL